MTDEKAGGPSAFDKDNILIALMVTVGRLYDVQMMLLKEQNPAAYAIIRDAHAQGRFLAPPPALQINE